MQKVGVEAVSAVEKASIILTIVSTAVQLLQKISELGSNKAFREYEAYAEKVREINALTDAVSQYRLAVLEARQEEDSWFAEDGLRNLKDWREHHDEVYASYVKKASEARPYTATRAGAAGSPEPSTGSWGIFRHCHGGTNGATCGGREDMTREPQPPSTTCASRPGRRAAASSAYQIGGHSQKTEDLVTWAQQRPRRTVRRQGLIDKELAKSILDNYGDKLVGQTRETLEALIELREKYDEYLRNLREYVSSMYEPLVDNLVDSLWDWLDSGKDALDSFQGICL